MAPRIQPPPDLPPGRELELPGRGTTWVHEAPGPAGAPTLVLLHGWTATAGLNWFATFGPLSRHFHVVALDHRGHGRGIRSRERFRLADCADDAAALADVLGVKRFIAVGYSMGGPVAQLCWQRHRDRVAGLVLCATSRNFGNSAPARAMWATAGGLGLAARVAPAEWRRNLYDRVLERRDDGSPLATWMIAERRDHDLRALLEAGHAIGGFTSHDWIGEVDVPTAVVVTERDTVVPVPRQRKLAAAIPDATVHPVPGDHTVCSVRPDLFVPALVEACRSVATRADLAVSS
ncbi:MAG: alpha/beta hydrolase [Acidimicrobiales bacterium]|jgi:3-oxoadipate enol-lactonase|nr:alpha/beta hydrolase [Acidimicrobiales bacterium]